MSRQDDEARLAAALRENLRRRKARARALARHRDDRGQIQDDPETADPIAAPDRDTGKP
jgi:hypothetical protein